MAGVPYTFATATTSIPLSQLDANFNTQITIGSSTVGLGNTTTTLAGLSNVSTTALTVTNDASISGLTVGKGGGSVGTNTAIGSSALSTNSTGNGLTAFGYQALLNSTTSYNVAIGAYALKSNTTGTSNEAFGYASLYGNTTGNYNVAVGDNALQANTTASNNTAVGYQAGYSNTTGTRNIFIGYQAGYSGATTSYNCIIGNSSGYNLTSTSYGNTFVGADFANGCGSAITTGTRNTIIGGYSGNNGGLDIRTASNYIVLSDGDGNPRGIFDSSGNLLVGTTSLYGGEKLAVLQSTNNRGVVLQQTNASNTSVPFNIDCSRNTTNSTYGVIQYFNSGAGLVRFVVQDSGNVQNTNNSYGAVSDIKLKENIVDASPKLEDLCKVKIRQYNLKSDPTHKQIGVVAQELEEVFAGMVEESPDRDADGNDLGTTTKAVKYSVFVPMLIKAIQELKAEFDAYKATHP